MKDSLIGIVTLTVLLGVVWVSQQKSKTEDLISNFESEKIESNENINNNETDIEIVTPTESLYACDLCNIDSDVNDNLNFTEAFKYCRNCLGDNEEFLWRGKLYSTKVKKEALEKNNLVEKEATELISPPNNETVDSE